MPGLGEPLDSGYSEVGRGGCFGERWRADNNVGHCMRILPTVCGDTKVDYISPAEYPCWNEGNGLSVYLRL